MALVAEEQDCAVEALCAVRCQLNRGMHQRPACVAILRGFAFQSSGIWAFLISFFSLYVLRCFRALTRLASTI